jgi:hypothetical protein
MIQKQEHEICKTNVETNFYYANICKHEHEKNLIRKLLCVHEVRKLLENLLK